MGRCDGGRREEVEVLGGEGLAWSSVDDDFGTRMPSTWRLRWSVESIASGNLRQKRKSRAVICAVIKACWGRTGSRTPIVAPVFPHQVLLTTKQPLFSPHHSTAENEAKGNSRITRSVYCFVLSRCTSLYIPIDSVSLAQTMCVRHPSMP
jgi:hypothetical protein